MRKLACIALLFCCTMAFAQGAIGPALALFPVVVRFITKVFHIGGPSNPKGVPTTQMTPGITLEIADAKVYAAQQPCQNWTWAAAVESIIAPYSVPLTQDDMVTRVEGGSVCKDQSPNFERMSRALSGNLYLEDGHKITLEARNVTGAPTVIDDILLSMKNNHPLILFWKGHAYLLKGVVYNELIISTNGARVFEIQELKLLDPAPSKPEEREVSFLRDRDDADQIDGVMDVQVKPEDGQSWIHPETEYQKNHTSPAERPVGVTPSITP
ncbi:MAG: hypothetical protein ACJ71N_07565 [Terriglobales bacterium]